MLEKIKGWFITLIIYMIIEISTLLIFFVWLPDLLIFVFFGFLLLNGIWVGLLLFNYQRDLKQRVLSISQILGKEGQEALQVGKLGLMTYDDDYQITWTSELFDEHQTLFVSQKLTKVLPELRVLFSGEEDKIIVNFDNKIYRVFRKENAQVIYWQDITEIDNLSKEYQENKPVVGMIHLDNYNDTIQNEDEQLIALINSNIRQLVVQWAKEKNIMIRRLRSDRFIILLNEKKYLQLEEDHFAIIDSIRTAAQAIKVDVTLSMAFARGSNDFYILGEMVNNLLELAQSRGGDQVVMRRYQREVKFFGGTSEAVEKSSKVKARVIAQAIKDLVEKSTEVFIVGHLDIDFDCMGAMLALSKMAQVYSDKVYVVTENVSIDYQLDEALYKYFDTIANKHNFISEVDARELVSANSMVICVDHHHLGLCNSPELVNSIKRLVVIDHHRRGESFFVNPTLVYVEPSASSSSELVVELLEYQQKPVTLEPFESTLMLTGIMVDTNHFRVRSGTRTFEAAGLLKSKGANSSEAQRFLKEGFEDFEMKNQIYSCSSILNDNIIIAAADEKLVFKRSIISQAADELLDIKNIEAAFVIAKTDNNYTIISARSKGKINVQVILEKMDGGGHFSAAGLQRENMKVEVLKKELLEVLKEGKDESNTTK